MEFINNMYFELVNFVTMEPAATAHIIMILTAIIVAFVIATIFDDIKQKVNSARERRLIDKLVSIMNKSDSQRVKVKEN